MRYAAERVLPGGIIHPHEIIDEIVHVEVRTTDDPLDKVHGTWKTGYLKERPYAGTLVVKHNGVPLTLVPGSPSGPNEYACDWKRGIIFVDPAESWNGLVVSYQGLGSIVDWERLQFEYSTFDKPPVIDEIDLTSGPVGVISKGDRYINTVTGTSFLETPVGSGIYVPVTKDYIYEWDGTGWHETPCAEGMILYNLNLAKYRIYSGGAWNDFSTGGGVPEAPSDGNIYSRKDASWVNISPRLIPEWANDTCPITYGLPSTTPSCECSTAIGHCTVAGTNGVSIGRCAQSNNRSVNIGGINSGCCAVSVGAGSCSESNGVSIGYCSVAGSACSIAIGSCANTLVSVAADSIAIGNGARGRCVESIALGKCACALELGSIAVGTCAQGNGVSIGYSSCACGGVAVGSNALALGGASIAIGPSAVTNVSNYNQIAIGVMASVNSDCGIAIGSTTYSCGTYGVAISGGVAYGAVRGFAVGGIACCPYSIAFMGECTKRKNEFAIRTNSDETISPQIRAGYGKAGLRRKSLAGTGNFLPLYTDSSSGEFLLTSSKGTLLAFAIKIVGKTADSSFGASFMISGALKTNSAGTDFDFLDVPDIVQYGGDSDTDAQVSKQTSPLRLRVEVKDKVGRTMHWHAAIDYAEMVDA